MCTSDTPSEWISGCGGKLSYDPATFIEKLQDRIAVRFDAQINSDFAVVVSQREADRTVGRAPEYESPDVVPVRSEVVVPCGFLSWLSSPA